MNRTTLAETVGRTHYALLDLTVSGRVFRYTDHPGGLAIDSANVSVYQNAFESGTVAGFVQGGNADWEGSTARKASGAWAAKSGTITDSQTSYMERTFVIGAGGGAVTFDQLASSESGFDYLRFYIDGVQQDEWSGNNTTFTAESYTLTAGSHTLRWSYEKDSSVSHFDDAGYIDNVLVTGIYDPPLSFVYEDGLTASIPARVAEQARSIGIQIDANGSQWMDLVGRGVEYDRARCVVRAVYVSPNGATTTLDRCRLVLDGFLSGVSYGGAQEPLAGTIEPEDLGTGIVPLMDMVVGPSTFTAADIADKAVGRAYPIVIGSPGQTGAAGAEAAGATTPGYLVDFDSAFPTLSRIMIAGHPTLATTVDVWDDEGNGSTGQTVLETTDLLGRVYSYVQTTGDPKRTYSVGWSSGGGVVSPSDSSEALSGAGDLIIWLLGTWAPSFRLDLTTQYAAREALNKYRLDFCITSAVDPVSFVRQSIASILPVDEIRTSNGYAWIPRRLTADASEAVAHLNGDAGGNIVSDTRIAVDSAAIANEIRLQYGPTGRSAERALTIIGDSANTSADGTIDARRRIYYPLIVSQSRYGRRVLSVSSSIIMDDSTASIVLYDLVMARAFPHRRIGVTGGSEFDRLEVNDVVTITVTDLQLSAVVCIVRSVEPQGDTVRLGLEITDEPAKRLRVT